MFKPASFIISSLTLVVLFVATTSVTLAATNTRIRGNVYDISNPGGPLGGLTVTVVCQGHTKTAVTDGFGLYVVDYPKSDCGKYQPVSASVSFHSQTQSQTVLVADVYRATMDFNFGAISVPEFGQTTWILALFGSLGAFLFLRKKMITTSHATVIEKNK